MSSLNKVLPILVILAVVGAATGGYFYFQYQEAQKEIQKIKDDPATLKKAAEEEIKKLLSEIGNVISLPDGEQPTVATVTDIEKLKDQPFFSKAKNGDKVVIYTNSKKAILYDPNTKKIIEVAPVNIGTPSAQAAQAKIALRNGTSKVGITGKVETDIKKAFPEANIASKENANSKNYEKTTVIILNDSAKIAAESLAKSLNISTGDLPAGEDKPSDMDILIIIGKDKV